MKKLHRLVYTSVRNTTCTDEEIDKIISSCKKNNPHRNITGILMYSKKRFIQYLEGSKDELTELYELIKTDTRHSGVMLRDISTIDERRFPSWHMGYKNVDSVAYSTDISSVDKKVFEGLMSGEIAYDDMGMRVLQLYFKMN